ncbi:GLPGLI family protein [Flavobacterium sp. CG_23.5]|uniref:GLPGLI family protein n=1 Tax=unclassified Flavobacterium TaxID=196869 RepID=UPI0018CA3D67|nr:MULTISPECIES: GLPGLI family protein [unclassified Flavobacterium]MBG6110580.1 GLPGLI family protein [Flavobacterium sp. CG_9.10]MBP2283995.1 GLPGLI family protein [Flavobacterium sp. CG_23.5]
MKSKSIFFIVSFFCLAVFLSFNSIDANDPVIAVYYKMGRYADAPNKVNANISPNIQLKIDEYEKAKNNVELALYFKKRVAVFKLVDKLNIEDNNPIDKLIAITAGGTRYCNNDSKQRIKQIETLGEKFNVILPFDEYRWTITTETKKINGYICYKATSHKEEFSKFRNRTISMDPTVWFTPEMPFSFGPSGLDGLPGLVLEGSINGKTYFYATKIVFDYKNAQIDFEKPKNGKYITPDELEEIQVKKMNEK